MATKKLQIIGSTFSDKVEAAIADKITSPAISDVGDLLAVKSVDKNGKPTEWETIDKSEVATDVTCDTTLSISGAAADAKTTGDAINNLKLLVGNIAVSEQISKATADLSRNDHNHDDTYDAKGSASDALTEANTYTDNVVGELSEGFENVIYSMYGDDITEDGAPTIRQIANDEATAVANTKADANHTHTKSQITDFPATMPNPNALIVDGQTYDGSTAVSLYTSGGKSVKYYGAKGDGTTDDTTAFQNALAANRVVFVPGGTYKLSDTLVIRPNCALELSQDTVLQFTQTSGNCIEVGCSATLNGNHAIISVPYAFTGHIIDIDTTGETERETPPYTHWDPMWKSGRYIYDVCLVKANSSGLHYSTNGVCSGTAIYMSANSKSALGYIWGSILHGIRIAGAFTYGIHVINYDDTTEDDGWNHDMRIEAVIQGCETGVSMTNCNNAHLAVAIQPSTAVNGTKYAKWGVYLNDCKNIDMSSANIWDWQTARTDSTEYSYVAMYGGCPGLILSDMRYNQSATDVRDQIYTDTQSNLDNLIIMQEPITRWFKPVDGVPYFNNGNANKRLMVEDDFKEYFDTNRVASFSDALASAISADGNVYNGVGYKEGIVVGNTGTESSLAYYVSTGYIACKPGDVLYMQDISFDTPVPLEDGSCKVVYYDANFNRVFHATCMNIMGGSQYYQAGERTDDGMKFTAKSTLSEQGTVAYVRFTFHIYDFGDAPIISVNDEIKYVIEGFLADTVKVKGNNMYLYSPSGKTFKLNVSDNGTLTTEVVTV